MRFAFLLAVALSAVMALESRGLAASEADLSSVRAFYLSASYEEALRVLDGISTEDADEQVDQYRALCYLALERTAEAERALEQIVLRNPGYAMAETEVSPRLVDLFRDIRARALPGALREMYNGARSAYTAKDFAAASDRLRRVIQIVNDEASDAPSGLADLRQLSEGFLRLSEGELSSAAERAAAAARSAAQAADSVGHDPARVYGSADPDVVAPVEINRQMPSWYPPNHALRRATLTGLLEFVVDTGGTVESAVLVEPLSPYYDPSLVAAAKRWQFRPAIRDGQPVKFRKRLEIVLEPPR